MCTLYRLLNDEAQGWWYHRELRKGGQTKEARRRERESIRNHAAELRATLATGGYMHIGRGGWSLHYSTQGPSGRYFHELQGYGNLKDRICQAALWLGIPIVDTNTIPESRIMLTLQLPLVADDPARAEPPPWTSLSRAPLAVVLAAEKALGATVHNFTPPPCNPAHFGGATNREAKLMRAFAEADQFALFHAMHEDE